MAEQENGERTVPVKKAAEKEKSKKGQKATSLGIENFHWSKILAGAYLAIFYGIAIYLSVMTLATHQIQQKTKALSTPSIPIYFWLLKEIGDEDRRLQQQHVQSSDAQKDEMEKKRAELIGLLVRAAEVEPDYKSARSAYEKYMNDILKPTGIAAFKAKHKDTYLVPEVKYNFLAANLLDYAPSNMEATKQTLEKLRSDFKKIASEREELNPKIENLQAALKLYEGSGIARLEETERILKKIYHTDDPEHIKQIYVLAKEFRALEDSFCIRPFGYRFCILNSLATKQPEIVTLVLVLIMGALGGLIHLTQGFLDDEKTPVSYYIFRPILGILAAFSIFVLVKAGVLVMSGESFDETKSLNPFFVAFLGIVSGLMAQNAIMNLRQAGSNLFRSQNSLETRRWAIADAGNSIMDKIKEQPDKDISKLAKILDQEQGQVEDWLHGRKRAPMNVQQAVASWLDRDVHELFHDMKTYKPDNKPPNRDGTN